MSARAIQLTGSDQAALASGPGTLAGYAIRETAGSAATAFVYDNASAASGNLLAVVSVGANGVADVSFNGGRYFQNGLYVDVGGSGTLAGSLFVA